MPGDSSGLALVAQRLENPGRRPDELYPPLCARPGECRAFREEPVARMNGVTALAGRNFQKTIHVQIGGHAGGPQRHDVVPGPCMQAGHIVVGMYHRRVDVQVGGSPGNTYGDFAPVRNEQMFELHGVRALLGWFGAGNGVSFAVRPRDTVS